MYLMRHSSKPARLLQLAAELDAEPSADRPTPLMLHALAANGKRDALLEQVRLLRKRMGVEAFAPLASRQRSTTRRDARDQATQQGQYESDFDAVACYLEGVQADQLLRKTLPTAEQLKQLSERLGFDVTPALESARSVQMPTRYEDPIAHAVLANLMERVQSTPTAKSFASDRKVLIGTLDTSQPSAEVLVAPASRACMKPAVTTSAYDRRVVTVNWRLFSFAHEMAKDIIPTLGLFAGKGGVSLGIGEAAFARRMREEPELSQQFSSNIKDFLMIVKSGGRGDLPKGFPVALVNELRDGAELFVVAHEYAHILANHDIEAAAPTPERLTTLWKDELQADFLAVKMVADIAEQAKDEIIGATLLHYGSLFMMQGLHVLEQSEHLHKVGSPPLHTEAEIEDALRYSNDVLDAKPLKVEGLARQARTVSRHGNSPPLWLRKRLVQGYVEGEYASRFPNNEAMAALGRSFSIHMAFAYEAAIPDFKNGPSTSLLQEVVNQVHLEEP